MYQKQLCLESQEQHQYCLEIQLIKALVQNTTQRLLGGLCNKQRLAKRLDLKRHEMSQ